MRGFSSQILICPRSWQTSHPNYNNTTLRFLELHCFKWARILLVPVLKFDSSIFVCSGGIALTETYLFLAPCGAAGERVTVALLPPSLLSLPGKGASSTPSRSRRPFPFAKVELWSINGIGAMGLFAASSLFSVPFQSEQKSYTSIKWKNGIQCGSWSAATAP